MSGKETKPEGQDNAPTRRRLYRGPAEGNKVITSFQDLDKQEEELKKMVSQIRATSAKNPTEVCRLSSQRILRKGR